MAIIHFLSSAAPRTVAVNDGAAGTSRPTLLAIARDSGVPILFNCEAGECGACLVEVTVDSGTMTPLTEQERFFLAATYRPLPDLAAGGGGERLACQYRPAEEEVTVAFENFLGAV